MKKKNLEEGMKEGKRKKKPRKKTQKYFFEIYKKKKSYHSSRSRLVGG